MPDRLNASRLVCRAQLAAIAVLALLIVSNRQAIADEPAIGQTRVARWEDDKTACFLLMFDDSWPSAWQVAAPELVKRGMIATFYLNPGKGEYQKFAKNWEQDLWKEGMVYGDHTMTHKGVKDFDDADREIGDCAKIIARIVPGKEPRLISYAQPGVAAGAWNITPAQLDKLLDKYHLVSRGDIQGRMAVYHLQTAEQMLALVDKAIVARSVDFLVIHGVERITPDWGYQDFWALKQSIFLPVLDGLKERQDKGELWITDHISSHQYAKERDSSTVKVLEAGDNRIRLDLSSTADPALYDLPLTLLTHTPAGWQGANVTQGERTTTTAVRDGAVQYRAVPNAGPITLTPAAAPPVEKATSQPASSK
jgi:peptidoglycan/xylan/chitin deacetylase (PgdA/CDA1 family)